MGKNILICLLCFLWVYPAEAQGQKTSNRALFVSVIQDPTIFSSRKEILDLVSTCDKRKAPAAQTRVLVALAGLDDNAKLLAKEKRIFTLGLSRINMLMDLYGKSPILHAKDEAVSL